MKTLVLWIPLALSPAPAQEPEREPGPVRCGLDVLADEDFAALRGRKLGLITNHTGRSAAGRGIVDLLLAADGVDLQVLFSPEHGFDGVLDQAKIDDGRHPSGLRIRSLYGATRSPTPEMLAGLDTLVFDIQDIGCRFYTYIATMKRAMAAAAQADLHFVVLDRPNPIGGLAVEGPVLAVDDESFVAAHPLPLRHGMTVGELAQMFAEESSIDVKLQVIPCQGWRRDMLWDATGLTWVSPSPNMRTLNQALLYPGVGLLEFTNVSVGRGTDTPFEILGAPWIDGRALASLLRSRQLPGVTFVPVEFQPRSSKFADELCGGVQILITDRDVLDPIRTGLSLAHALRRFEPSGWQIERFARLLAEPKAFAAIRDGAEPEAVIAGWQDELQAFRLRRESFLIYR